MAKTITIYVRSMNQKTWKEFKKKALDSNISAAEAVHRLVAESLKFHRILCPECDGIFWVEKDRKWRCPYCGAEQNKTIDDFIIN